MTVAAQLCEPIHQLIWKVFIIWLIHNFLLARGKLRYLFYCMLNNNILLLLDSMKNNEIKPFTFNINTVAHYILSVWKCNTHNLQAEDW